MNKVDVFEKKIKSPGAFKSFKEIFPGYKGEDYDLPGTCEFLANQFRQIYKKETAHSDVANDLTVHTTCALDTEGMRHVFNSVRTNLLSSSLNQGDSGFVL